MARGELAVHGARARPARTRAAHRPSIKLVLFGAVVLCLAGIVGVAISQETTSSNAAVQSAARPALSTPRPARRPEEQAYIDALWPIHSQLERTALRVALGATFYKTKDLDRADFKTRLDQSLTTYREAEQQLRDLQPPSSLQASRQDYVAVVQLFEQSTAEMLKMYDDGNEDHLTAGFPKSKQGADQMRDLGTQFWPDEYPPN